MASGFLLFLGLVLGPNLVSSCSEQEFSCPGGLCVARDRLCDFTDDCGDGSDEKNCSAYTRCDFEDGFCDLIQSSETPSGWTRTTHAAGLQQDHRNTSAHFLSLSDVGIAELSSPPLRPTDSCQMRFYHYVGTPRGGLVVLVRSSSSGQSSEDVEPVSHTQMDAWQRTVVHFSSNSSFQLVIRGELPVQREASDVLAIDDFSFSPGCVPEDPSPPPPACPPSWFSCGGGRCIEERKVCDFTPHCPNGEDELSCPSRCDFERGSCGWYEFTHGDGFDWVRGTSAEIPPDYFHHPPLPDHSTNSTEGHFMFILKNSSSLYPKAVLRGPWFQQSASGCTMTFWHYNSGISVGAADMYLRVDGVRNSTVIWTSLYDQGRRWNRVRVQLGRITRPFQIALAKISLGVFDGVSALDDVAFEGCSLPPATEDCPENTHFHCARSRACVERLRVCDLVDDCGDGSDEEGCSPDLQCDFESGLCGWRQEVGGADAFDWTLISGPTPTLNTGPWKDHTLGTRHGHYLYVESSLPQEFRDTALLLSPVFGPTLRPGEGEGEDPLRPMARRRRRCVFRFHYCMSGPHVFSLAVYLRTTAAGRGSMIWAGYGDQGNLWHRKTLYLHSARPFQILIEGTVGDDFLGDIAIDDLSFLDCERQDGELPSLIAPAVTTPAPTVVPSSCPQGQFVCATPGECVPLSQVCDFRRDCSDGLDESSCVKERCDFEGGDTCGWTVVQPLSASGQAFRWAADQGESIHNGEQDFRPANDHTLNSPEGWYLFADSSNGHYGQPSDLQTPLISSTGPLCTLVFWYHMNGFTVGTLQVLLRRGNATHLVWSQTGNQGNKWRQGKVFLGLSLNIQVVFRAKRGISYMGDVVMDDVSFLDCAPPPPPPSGKVCTPEQFACTNGHCVPQDHLCDFTNHCGDGSDEDPYICKGFGARCDFEFDLCSWRQSPEDDFNWLIKAGSTPTFGTGPSTDHTLRDPSGHYLYLESSFPQKAGDAARVVGPLLSSRSSQCTMRFYLHMSGDGIGTLSVFTQTKGGLQLRLNLTGDQGNFWQMKELPLSSVEDFRVLLEGRVGRTEKGDICLDDISFSPGCLLTPSATNTDNSPSPTAGPCPPGSRLCGNGRCFSPEQSCDFTDDCGDGTDEEDCGTSCSFENGHCGWKSSLADNFDWALGTGSLQAIRPPHDHTLMDENGHFIYLEATPVGLKGDKAHIWSSVWRESSAICKLSFWYYISQKASGTIRLLIKTENDLVEMWNETCCRGNQWHRAEVPLRKLRNFQVIFEGIRMRDVSGGAALDDLEFSQCSPSVLEAGSCPVNTDFVCRSGHCIESHLVCDSKADCADQSDEADCDHVLSSPGACDFNLEVDEWEERCQLSQDSDDDFDWRIGHRTETPGAGPHADHSSVGGGNFLYIHSAAQREGDVARVTTSRAFPASIGLCRLRFWFFMNSSETGTLKVYTVGSSGSPLLMWAATGNHGNGWAYANVVLSNPSPFRVTFQAEVGGDMWTDIALDDISYTAECTTGGPVTPQPPTCAVDQFQCLYSFQCIPGSWWCDGEPDCGDLSDEERCPSAMPGTLPPQDGCPGGFFRCSDHRCLPAILRCDGVPDCPEGEDEHSCPLLQCELGELVCESAPGCIPAQRRCDQTPDCLPFLSDESSCHECPPGFCLARGSCVVEKRGPVCTCQTGWTGNRCQVETKPPLPTSPPTEEDTQPGSVHAGVAVAMLLLLGAGGAVCLMASCRNKRRLSKTNAVDYGVMDDPRFDLAKPGVKSPVGDPGRGGGGGLSISVYPWKKELEWGSNRKDAKLSFTNPLYNYTPDPKGTNSTSSDA